MMTRPVAVHLGEAARIVSEVIGRVSIGQQELQWVTESQKNQQAFQEQMMKAFERLERFTVQPFSIATLNLVAVWKDIIQQLSFIETETESDVQENNSPQGESKAKVPTLHLTKLIALDPADADRRFGVCSIPLYEFAPDEVERLHAGKDIEAARDILQRHDILQYFFPSADQLTLGFAEHAPTSSADIMGCLVRTPEAGHPFGQLEIVERGVSLHDMVAALQDRGLLVEGEAGVEVTAKGKSLRAKVRFKPRESLFVRLAHVFSMKIHLNLQDLLKK